MRCGRNSDTSDTAAGTQPPKAMPASNRHTSNCGLVVTQAVASVAGGHQQHRGDQRAAPPDAIGQPADAQTAEQQAEAPAKKKMVPSSVDCSDQESVMRGASSGISVRSMPSTKVTSAHSASTPTCSGLELPRSISDCSDCGPAWAGGHVLLSSVARPRPVAGAKRVGTVCGHGSGHLPATEQRLAHPGWQRPRMAGDREIDFRAVKRGGQGAGARHLRYPRQDRTGDRRHQRHRPDDRDRAGEARREDLHQRP